jgi:hypothetical protein
MSKNIREAICFMDPKKRMAGLCQAPELSEIEVQFILHQLRKLN